ncbi:hypothetical protein BABINDRAFT_160137 [Babjeviella inositovora NRRL Y-12698]|uniref:Uncharacterized protein n=1 Tax=Babjeviella inositovora NRRL Y-12698 TaxID=984486 RepID=A0A1E3QXX5_9ASCO|nr:uncharacterized protein BABINDRAFT_160137 [Babjeviella inositovora NRRL Y-12698]ODQ81907.1 hypothetical protein BABINDRAFT_160137 [Babjeviella inositovora NRRL Y-12698]
MPSAFAETLAAIVNKGYAKVKFTHEIFAGSRILGHITDDAHMGPSSMFALLLIPLSDVRDRLPFVSSTSKADMDNWDVTQPFQYALKDIQIHILGSLANLQFLSENISRVVGTIGLKDGGEAGMVEITAFTSFQKAAGKVLMKISEGMVASGYYAEQFCGGDPKIIRFRVSAVVEHMLVPYYNKLGYMVNYIQNFTAATTNTITNHTGFAQDTLFRKDFSLAFMSKEVRYGTPAHL